MRCLSILSMSILLTGVCTLVGPARATVSGCLLVTGECNLSRPIDAVSAKPGNDVPEAIGSSSRSPQFRVIGSRFKPVHRRSIPFGSTLTGDQGAGILRLG